MNEENYESKYSGGLFSYFKKPVTNTKPNGVKSLQELHKTIVSELFVEITKEANRLNSILVAAVDPTAIKLANVEYDKYKKTYFDYLTFNGVFENRSEAGIKESSGLFILD